MTVYEVLFIIIGMCLLLAVLSPRRGGVHVNPPPTTPPPPPPQPYGLPPHLRKDAPYRVCDTCGRKTWYRAFYEGERCGMTQPDGSTCEGLFGRVVHP